MNIKILDSTLRKYLKTEASPEKISEILSLTSASVEKLEHIGDDWSYDIEVTTNRPDMMSVMGIAREAAAALDAHGVAARFERLPYNDPKNQETHIDVSDFSIVNDDSLVSRICALVMDVEVKPQTSSSITKELEAAGMRSLNNLIDITNYVMLITGHPTHVFDFDRLNTNKLIIRESKKGEKITTLDEKTYTLPGGDIIATDGKGRIVDLLGIMGLENSVVTDQTKRVLFFIDNVDQHRIRKTSMTLGIRTDAAQLNEKGLDTELSYDAFAYGVELFKQFANAKPVSHVFDIYPHPYTAEKVSVTEEQIASVVGVPISLERSTTILQHLGFGTKINDKTLTAMVPSIRAKDIDIPEDIIEEIARIYGYHNIPSELPPLADTATAHVHDMFYWEHRIKETMKFWGFTEVYTYSMVDKNLFEGELSDAVTIKNPLNDDMVYMRRTLVPSLLLAVAENKMRDVLRIFEIANVYVKRQHDLPHEKLHFAGVLKKPDVSFFEVKGIFEQLAVELGIRGLIFKPMSDGSTGAEMFIASRKLGTIEILDKETIDFEADFSILTEHATAHKTFTPLAKYPAIIEDMTFVLGEGISVGEVEIIIKQQSDLIIHIVLIDKYQNTRTFRIYYQHQEKNLTGDDITPIRKKISDTLTQKLHVTQK